MYFLNIFQDQNYLATPKKIFFYHYFKNLIVTLKVTRKNQQRSIYFKGQLSRASHLDKNMELLKCLIVLYEQFINRKTKERWNTRIF